jgi:hypothetical protein
MVGMSVMYMIPALLSSHVHPLKGVCHKIFWVLFWHVWIDLGLYKNL